MRDRGKDLHSTFNGESSFLDAFPSDLPCRRHPPSSSSSSNGGICPLCLRDKLAELVCPTCGEQRHPFCSCSGHPPAAAGEPLFRRSNSTCNSDVKNRAPFWKLGKLFRTKKKDKGTFQNFQNFQNFQTTEKKEEPVGFSRSRSLCSFRGGGGAGLFYDAEESGGAVHSAARVSSVSTGGFAMDSAKRSCFSESEARMSNFEGRMSNFDYERDMVARGIYSMREGCEFDNGEDPKFIDLKLDLPSSSSSEPRTEYSVLRQSGYGSMRGEYLGNSESYGVFGSGDGSGKFGAWTDAEFKKCRKSRKGWKRFFKG